MKIRIRAWPIRRDTDDLEISENKSFKKNFEIEEFSLNKFWSGFDISIVDEKGHSRDIGNFVFNAFNLSGYNFNFLEDNFEAAMDNCNLKNLIEVEEEEHNVFNTRMVEYYKAFKGSYHKFVKKRPANELASVSSDIYLLGIDNLWIYPEEQNKGIEEYIIKHLCEIMYAYFNIKVAFSVMTSESLEKSNFERLKSYFNKDFSVSFKYKGSESICSYIFKSDFF